MSDSKSEGKPESKSKSVAPAAPAEDEQKTTHGGWIPRGYCIQCSTLVTIPNDKTYGLCRCPNNTTVTENGVTSKNPRLAMNVDAFGILSRIIPGKTPSIAKIKGYINLCGKPIRLFNGSNEQIGLIEQSPNTVVWNNPVTVDEWEPAMPWPVPIVGIQEDAPMVTPIEIEGATKKDKFIAPEYLAYCMYKCGYTNVVTPDTSEASVVYDVKTGIPLGYKRLARWTKKSTGVASTTSATTVTATKTE